MASYSVAADHVGAHEKQLAPATVDTVTFASDLAEVEVISDGSADIYVSFGAGNAPTVAGSQCWRVPAGSGGAVFQPRTSGPTVVNLISAGSPVYSVARTS
jgi:hypothetical protein